MWLPAPLYERLPQIWLFSGLLFFVFGLYLGFTYDMIYAYLGLGAMCIVYSVWLFKRRHKHREKPGSSSETQAHDSDQATTN